MFAVCVSLTLYGVTVPHNGFIAKGEISLEDGQNASETPPGPSPRFHAILPASHRTDAHPYGLSKALLAQF